MSKRWWMKEPCEHCPFRRDVKPFLHPSRGEQFAYLTENRYSEFHCHKTIEHDEEDGEPFLVHTSLVCAGFLSMQANANDCAPEGFTPSDLVYSDAYEMADAYEDAS